MEVLCVLLLGERCKRKGIDLATPELNTHVLHRFGSLFPCTVVLLGGR